ncbi:hypothetical protein DIPPA_08457 [Diplonema papillatum]|nr:hypothetical protein DIPPA_08457 [Diplonema papillatum]
MASQPVFRIIQLNDVYSLDNLPRFSALRQRLVDEVGKDVKVITVLAGDFLSPSLLSALDNGKAVVECMNDIGIDFVCIGNHENDVPLKELHKRIRESKFVWINSNIENFKLNDKVKAMKWIVNNDLPRYATATSTDGKRKLAFLGVLTEDKGLYPGECFGGATIKPPIEAAEAVCKEIAEKEKDVDLVVPMTHQTMPEDRAFVEHFAKKRDEEKVFNFPVICGGHDHTLYHETLCGSEIIKVGCDADTLAAIDIWWEGDEPKIKIKTVGVAKEENEDTTVRSVVDSSNEILKEFDSAVLFTLSSNLSSKNIRKQPVSMARHLVSTIRDAVYADCAIINAGAIRGSTDYKKGQKFTHADLKTEMPFGSPITTADLTGQVISDSLAFSRRLSKQDPPVEKGGYLQSCDAIEVDDQDRITHIGGKNLDPKKKYRVACLYQALIQKMDDIEPLYQAGEQLKPPPSDEASRPAKHVLVTRFARNLWWDAMQKQGCSFCKIDSNKDGLITKDELRNSFGSCSDIVVSNIWNLMNANDDDSIDPVEFFSFYMPIKLAELTNEDGTLNGEATDKLVLEVLGPELARKVSSFIEDLKTKDAANLQKCLLHSAKSRDEILTV